jgi:hypothetical protein
VSGQVLVKGQPAKGVTVTLHPVAAPAADGQTVFPTAQTDDAGKFTLTSYQTGDGAVPGEYKVTATRYEIPPLKNGKKPTAEGDTPPAVNVLPAKYASPVSTPLQVAVKPGANEPITITIDR